VRDDHEQNKPLDLSLQTMNRYHELGKTVITSVLQEEQDVYQGEVRISEPEFSKELS
jgi:hypothetical protein